MISMEAELRTLREEFALRNTIEETNNSASVNVASVSEVAPASSTTTTTAASSSVSSPGEEDKEGEKKE